MAVKLSVDVQAKSNKKPKKKGLNGAVEGVLVTVTVTVTESCCPEISATSGD